MATSSTLTAASCCYAAGGRVRITANGTIWSARAAVTIIPVNFERTVNSNQDGTIYVTTKPMPYEAKLTLSDGCGIDITAIMACPIDVTIELIDVTRTYLFSKAVVVGRPEINTETGEISGLIITSNTLTITNVA
jgi:hypothetical protein